MTISRGYSPETPESDCPYPQCPNHGRLTSHYHCALCDDPEPTSYMGHHVGGATGKIICDPAERSAYLRNLATRHMTTDECNRGGDHDPKETIYRHPFTGAETSRRTACHKCGAQLS